MLRIPTSWNREISVNEHQVKSLEEHPLSSGTKSAPKTESVLTKLNSKRIKITSSNDVLEQNPTLNNVNSLCLAFIPTSPESKVVGIRDP